VVLLVLLCGLCDHVCFFLCRKWTCIRRLDDLFTTILRADFDCRLGIGYVYVVSKYGIVYYLADFGRCELYQYDFEHAYLRDGLWKMPLTIWAFFLTAIVGLLSFPVLVSAVVLLIFDRAAGTSFYLSDLVIAGQILPNEGGSPILFQHLFWFLGHPEVYIVVMPA